MYNRFFWLVMNQSYEEFSLSVNYWCFLPVGVYLERHLNVDETCHFRFDAKRSVNHTFISCPLAQANWFDMEYPSKWTALSCDSLLFLRAGRLSFEKRSSFLLMWMHILLTFFLLSLISNIYCQWLFWSPLLQGHGHKVPRKQIGLRTFCVYQISRWVFKSYKISHCAF